jgi:hypothetical protein
MRCYLKNKMRETCIEVRDARLCADNVEVPIQAVWFQETHAEEARTENGCEA